MTEAGLLSIVRRGHTYQVRYATSNPYDMDRSPYLCADEDALVTWLRHCGIDAWSLQQASRVGRGAGEQADPARTAAPVREVRLAKAHAAT